MAREIKRKYVQKKKGNKKEMEYIRYIFVQMRTMTSKERQSEKRCTITWIRNTDYRIVESQIQYRKYGTAGMQDPLHTVLSRR